MNTVMDKTLKNELIKYATREFVRKGFQDVVDSTTPYVTIINPKFMDMGTFYTEGTKRNSF